MTQDAERAPQNKLGKARERAWCSPGFPGVSSGPCFLDPVGNSREFCKSGNASNHGSLLLG
eukprot:6279973-Pyramimonas_sp.AAC.1